MDQLLRKFVAIVLLSAAFSPLVYAQSSKSPSPNKTQPVSLVTEAKQHDEEQLIEEFSFLIKDFKLDHQAESHNLNISISYRYVVNIANSDYPDFRLLAKDVETFLGHYPNEEDYWEIVNKKLTQSLLTKYPTISSITSEVRADPTPLDPYVRSSRVTRERPPKRSSRKRPG